MTFPQVLRFDCYWDDTGSLYGDKNAFTLNYYLSDDTVSVNEVLIANSGKDHFPTLLKRSKLPRDWKVGKEVEDASRGVELMVRGAALCSRRGPLRSPTI